MESLGLTLVELYAVFLGQPYPNERGNVIYPRVESFQEAFGIRYLCPKCFAANGGGVNTHWVINFIPSIGQEWRPTPGRWNFIGTSMDDISLINESSSIGLTGGCEAHYFITNGRIADKRLEL